MSDVHLTAILTLLGALAAGVGAFMRWVMPLVGKMLKAIAERVAKALDDNTQASRDTAAAHLESARQLATLSTKVDTVYNFAMAHAPPIPQSNGVPVALGDATTPVRPATVVALATARR
jgi:F0F1-type ATP synthase membrane subunit b/b'